MSLYAPIWLEIPSRQRADLSPELRRAFDAKFELILDDPKAYGAYDKQTDQWTADFAEGRGLITYAVNDHYVKVIVLRIIDFS